MNTHRVSTQFQDAFRLGSFRTLTVCDAVCPDENPLYGRCYSGLARRAASSMSLFACSSRTSALAFASSFFIAAISSAVNNNSAGNSAPQNPHSLFLRL